MEATVIALEDFCTANPGIPEFEVECLVLYQARLAEAQQVPASVFEVLPYVFLLLSFGFGLLLGRGGR